MKSKPFSIASLPGAKETVVVAGSLSKTYAMTGWRIGFALAPASIIGAMMKLQSHSTSNPTSIAQKAAIEAMSGPQTSIPEMLAEYRKRRDFVVDRLRQMPGRHHHYSQGRLLRLSEYQRCVRQRPGQEFHGVRHRTAGEIVRSGCTR